jgi:hypothetical protein
MIRDIGQLIQKSSIQRDFLPKTKIIVPMHIFHLVLVIVNVLDKT